MNYIIEPISNHNNYKEIFIPKKDIIHFEEEEDEDDGGWPVPELFNSSFLTFQRIAKENDMSLIIVDPYFLEKQSDLPNYLSKFMDIIGLLSQYKAIHVVCSTQDEETRKAFNTLLGDLLSIQIAKNVQDRFWLTNKGLGLVFGTSFLGIEDIPPMVYPLRGNKYSNLYRALKRKYKIKI